MIKVAIDISPLSNQSKFRGVGVYTRKLLESFKNQKDLQIYEFENGKVPGEVNLVHYPYFSPLSLSLPIFPKKKFVVTVHDLTPLVFPQAYPPGYRGKLKYLIQKKLLKKASMIITDSQNSASDVVKFIGYPKEKIEVIYLAAANKVRKITDEKILHQIRTKFCLPTIFVLYVGDVNYNKNLSGLLKACRLIKTTLVIVGKQATSGDFDVDNIENRPLIELNKLIGEEKDVIRTGFVGEEELSALYSLASVYCQPSFYEGFGVPLLEAMACGCPVVASNLSSLPEVGGEAVTYVDPYKIEDIARGIKKLIENKILRTKIIQAGFEQAKQFSWGRTAQETIKVYEKVLEK